MNDKIRKEESSIWLADDQSIIGYVVDGNELHVTCPHCRTNMRLIKDKKKFLEEIAKIKKDI